MSVIVFLVFLQYFVGFIYFLFLITVSVKLTWLKTSLCLEIIGP